MAWQGTAGAALEDNVNGRIEQEAKLFVETVRAETRLHPGLAPALRTTYLAGISMGFALVTEAVARDGGRVGPELAKCMRQAYAEVEQLLANGLKPTS